MNQPAPGTRIIRGLTEPAGGRAPANKIENPPAVRWLIPPGPGELPSSPARAREPALSLLVLLIHELSQPVTALLGEMELALHFPQSEKEVRATLERCFRGLNAAAKLLLDFRALGEMNKRAVTASPLADIICKAVEGQKPVLEARACQLAWSVPAEAFIKTDPEALQKALSIILTKAINACPRGEALKLEFIECSGAAVLRFSFPRQARATPPCRIASKADPDWALAEGIIRLLGGALEFYDDHHFKPRACIDVTLILPD